MNEGRTVFAQLMDELPHYHFNKCVRRYDGDHHVRSLPTYEQFPTSGGYPGAPFRAHNPSPGISFQVGLTAKF